MALSALVQVTDQDVNSTSSSQGGAALGQVASTPDGRIFSYAKAGAVDLAAGKLTSPAAVTANYATRTLSTSFAAGLNQVTVTLGTTATQDAFAGFYLVVTDGTGKGQGAYRVVGNTAATAGNSNSTTVTIENALNVALDNTSVVGLYPSQFSSLVVSASGTAPAVPVSGAPVVAVTAAYYFWVQTGGYASILSDGAVTKNAEAISSNAVAGAAEIRVDATVTRAVGYAPELTVDGKYSPLVLTLDY